ncbi:PREDICTED: keratin, type I cytoskeletal 18-like, partial [Galeopterus variegatus]|uniref:Keratin, type I cytoskeletal 18-like n=1 Tax=Galeopterus variegatus TaxID=482537 RepID=A0ABM0SHA0_GALVR
NHEEEVKGLQAQIANSGLTVEVDAPQSQDLSKILADIGAEYEQLAQKNREELDKYWTTLIEELTIVIASQSTEIGDAEMRLKELRRPVQSLEIDLDSLRNLKARFCFTFRPWLDSYYLYHIVTAVVTPIVWLGLLFDSCRHRQW